MRVFRSTAAPAFVLALVLAACGGGTASTDEPDAGTDTDPSVAAPEDGTGDGSDGSSEGDAASVEVTVSGGAFEGTYSGSVADGGCSRGATGENTFGLQYSADQDVELSSLQLVANDASAASSGGSDGAMIDATVECHSVFDFGG